MKPDLNKQLLNLAVPNILSNLSVPLLGLVDTALVGHMQDKAYLGAISAGGAIFTFLYWGFGFLRMGTTGLTAQAIGGKDQRGATLILKRGLFVALIASIVILVLQLPIEKIAISLLDTGPEIKSAAREYFRIRIFAAPATLSLYVFYGWFLGMQDSKRPMIIAILINLLNIVLNLYFIKIRHMHVDGIALGTVISQYTGAVVAILLLILKYKDKLIAKGREKFFDKANFTKFFLLNTDITIRTFCLIFTLTFFTYQSASLGSNILQVNEVLRQFMIIMAFFIDGFAFAAESLVGKFTGSGEKSSLKRAIRLVLIWGMGFAFAFSLIYLLAGKWFLSLLTEHEDVVEVAVQYLPWLIVLPILASPAFIWDGIYLGATQSRPLRNTMLLATLAIFLPTLFITKTPLGNHGMWLSMILFMTFRSISLSVLAKKYILKT